MLRQRTVLAAAVGAVLLTGTAGVATAAPPPVAPAQPTISVNYLPRPDETTQTFGWVTSSGWLPRGTVLLSSNRKIVGAPAGGQPITADTTGSIVAFPFALYANCGDTVSVRLRGLDASSRTVAVSSTPVRLCQ